MAVKAAQSTLQQTLEEIHAMLAAVTHCRELVLSPDEAERLSKRMIDVQTHFPLPVPSPGKLALGMLFWTAGSIYVPKVRAIGERRARGGVSEPDVEAVQSPAPPGAPGAASPGNVSPGPSDWFKLGG